MHKRIPSGRLMLITLLIFLISSTASIFSTTQLNTVASLLTVPTAIPSSSAVASVHASPTAEGAPAIPPSALPTIFTKNTLKMVLVNDNFQRPDQSGWGKTPTNETWQEDAQTDPAFSIHNGQGHIDGENKTCMATYDSAGMYDLETLLTASLSKAQGNSLGVLFRWQDDNNWYGARFDAQHVILEKRVQGVTSIIQVVPFAARNNTMYTIRVLAVKSSIAVKVWPQNEPEPQNWHIFAQDQTFSHGWGGIYVTLQSNVQVNVTNYTTSGIYT